MFMLLVVRMRMMMVSRGRPHCVHVCSPYPNVQADVWFLCFTSDSCEADGSHSSRVNALEPMQ